MRRWTGGAHSISIRSSYQSIHLPRPVGHVQRCYHRRLFQETTRSASLLVPSPNPSYRRPFLSSTMSQANQEGLNQYRLPENVKPSHYDITILTDLESLSYGGFAKIDLLVKQETSTIVLNTLDLQLAEASVYSEALGKEIPQTSSNVDTKTERCMFTFSTSFAAGSKIQLRVKFKGKLAGNMTGYYKSSWENEGKTKHYALTQMEPTAARRAFPCWDEPLLKATFAFTLVSRADTVNLSNMPALSEHDYEHGAHSGSSKGDDTVAELFPYFFTAERPAGEKWKVTRFDATPPMSTYLAAFANGHFEHLESSYTSPLSGKTRPLRIYATADLIHQGNFALEVKARALQLYEKVFDIEYPLPKLDTLVAHDFDAGAMENWGLITGRTNALLLDPKRADLQAKKTVLSVQSHEVAHMWFGNITTMEWWNYLYLNEGFATVLGEVIIADKMYPEWNLDSEFIATHLHSALTLDAKLSSHPIEVDCPDANNINQIFDSLSYSKAASVLRMLSNFVGEELFLKGVSIYLKKHLFANSRTSDLWDGITAATGVDVNKIMENWITKIGYPVITVKETSDGIHIRQERFLETGPAESKDDQTIWTIPLSLLTADEGGKACINKTLLLDTREKTLTIDTNKPFKLNAGTSGVYRVLYTPERTAKIAAEAAKGDSVFSLKDRMGLLLDSYALARAGFSKLSNYLTLVDIFKNEKEFLVWDSISTNLSAIVSTWGDVSKVVENLNAFQQALFYPLIERLGYENSESDSPATTQLRTRAISQAAAAKDPRVVKELTGRFAQYLKSGDDSCIPADLVRVTYNTAVKYGGRAEYDAVRAVIKKPKTPSMGIAAISGICSTEDPQLAEETFQYILTEARDQDVIHFFRALSMNLKLRRKLTQFYKDNYEVLYKRFEGSFISTILVKASCSHLSTEQDLQDLQAFFKGKDTSKFQMGLDQTLDTIRANLAFVERSSADVQDWLEAWQRNAKM